MTVATTAALIADLDAAVHGRPPERRAEILRQVTDLFVSDAGHLAEAQVDVFDDVLVRLMKRVEAKTLARLSDDLAGLASAPRGAVRQLAFHEDASIATPVLSRSSRVSAEDLIEIASTRGQRHLLAMSGRQTLDESLSDLLVKRGDSTVRAALARNSGACLSEAGYATLVQDAERDDSLTEKLGLRPDIPAELLRQLVVKAGDKVRMRLLKAAPPELRQKIQDAISKVVELPAPKPVDYTGPKSKVTELNRMGKLNDSTVNRFAIDREYVNVVAALSFLATVTVETVEPLIGSAKLDGLVIACKAARLNWSTTVMVIRNRPGCAPVSEPQLDQVRKMFETLSLSSAQQTIRLWSAENAAKKHDRLAGTQAR